MSMQLSDFDYELPASLIAQQPLLERSRARLLVVDRKAGTIEHREFSDLTGYFSEDDVLVLNDTKVLKARLFGRKVTGGKVEILLHKRLKTDEWEVLLKPGGRVRQGSEIFLGENGNSFSAKVLDPPARDSGLRHVRFCCEGNLDQALDALGRVPLPPYIDRPDAAIDRELYQTVFARKEGAVASPTAGLHFDFRLLEKIKARGAETVYVTLHVGYGTFQPVAVKRIDEHRMHPETYEVPAEAAARLSSALAGRKRITACGTTVVRTLETLCLPRESGSRQISASQGETPLFIHPPYSFKAVDRLITNFHLPRTTLLMLVSAFTGHELLMSAYREAVHERYRFYSYGDAMLIL